jgi:hypothetical protein
MRKAVTERQQQYDWFARMYALNATKPTGQCWVQACCVQFNQSLLLLCQLSADVATISVRTGDMLLNL